MVIDNCDTDIDPAIEFEIFSDVFKTHDIVSCVIGKIRFMSRLQLKHQFDNNKFIIHFSTIYTCIKNKRYLFFMLRQNIHTLSCTDHYKQNNPV
jgi:hypothetical protein